jgi:quercetin dioxygenase-like cupin family protein
VVDSSGARVIENPASGERIVIRRTAAETRGRVLEFEVVLAPGGRVPAGHLHPEQEERFTVLEGQVRFRLGGRPLIASAGDTVTVSAGKPHSFANAGRDEARLLVEATPALHMEELLETASRLGGRPGLLELALFLREFGREVRSPVLPRMVDTGVRALAWAARRLGLDARYRRLREAARSG